MTPILAVTFWLFNIVICDLFVIWCLLFVILILNQLNQYLKKTQLWIDCYKFAASLAP